MQSHAVPQIHRSWDGWSYITNTDKRFTVAGNFEILTIHRRGDVDPKGNRKFDEEIQSETYSKGHVATVEGIDAAAPLNSSIPKIERKVNVPQPDDDIGQNCERHGNPEWLKPDKLLTSSCESYIRYKTDGIAHLLRTAKYWIVQD